MQNIIISPFTHKSYNSAGWFLADHQKTRQGTEVVTKRNASGLQAMWTMLALPPTRNNMVAMHIEGAMPLSSEI